MLVSHGALEKNRCLATSPGNRFNWPWRWGPGHQDFGEFFAKAVNLGDEEEESIRFLGLPNGILRVETGAR